MLPFVTMRHLSVRGRTVAVFALVALVLSTVTALTVWFTVSGYLLSQRQASATAQALRHADQLRTALQGGASDAATELGRLPRAISSVSLLRIDDGAVPDRWFASSLTAGRETIPPGLRRRVEQGAAARQRVHTGGDPVLVVGVPVPGLAADYFEVFPLDELERTFRVLSAVLLGSIVVLPLGTAVLGRWATTPALRPLDRISAAARSVADGDLSTRLHAGGDPALVALAESFNATVDALERRMRADARFAADVSHELRSPLTAMIGALSVIMDNSSSLPEESTEMLAILEGELTRFAALVEDLLEISRMDTGSAEVTLEDLPLVDLLRHAVPERYRNLVEVRDAAGVAVVAVDKRRFERVLANLLDNADRHGHGPTRVLADADLSCARVTVEDRGPGLSEEDRVRVFDRFARSRRSSRGSSDGAGLGLSLVARNVGLMHGSVTSENRPGGGASFIVCIPLSDRTEGRP